ncbi:MAG: hypothetical protein JNK08_09650 [Sediminibacterium sp.]|nr:hypothetical protein [Sediminibacterium sp.]
MIVTANRTIRRTTRYDSLFPKANGEDTTVLKKADLDDTMELIPRIVLRTLDHTRRISSILEKQDLEATCRNIWQFVYDHIAYRKDEDGKEQIRSPARSWMDRLQGVDCDCYTVFISSILCNLSIPHVLRIAKYRGDSFQHIYPVVLTKDSDPIILDCVTEFFDYEVPYTEKKDYTMELQYLNGPAQKPKTTANQSSLILFGYEPEGNWEGMGILPTDRLLLPSELTPINYDVRLIENVDSTTDVPATTKLSSILPEVPLVQVLPSGTSTAPPVPPPTTMVPIPTVAPEPRPIIATIAEPQQLFVPQPDTITPTLPQSATCTCTINGVTYTYSEEELGSIFSKIGDIAKSVVQGVGKVVKNVGEAVVKVAKTVVHVINKVLPTTALLRLGFLTALKLNLLKVSEHLRYAYLTPEQALRYGIDPEKHKKMGDLIEKIKKIFWQMGGNLDNIRPAIINGKGNDGSDRIDFDNLNGFGYTSWILGSTATLNSKMTLREILGNETYEQETQDLSQEQLNTLGALGEPVTAASIAAIMSTIVAIWEMIKKILPLKQGNATGVTDPTQDPNSFGIDDPELRAYYDEAVKSLPPNNSGELYVPQTSDVATTTSPEPTTPATTTPTPANTATTTSANIRENLLSRASTAVTKTATGATTPANTAAPTDPNKQPGFWDKYKVPIIVGGSLAGLALVIWLSKRNRHNGPPQQAMHGTKTSYGKKRSTHKKTLTL